MENKLAQLKALAMKAAAVEEIDAPARRSRLFPTARAAIAATAVLCVALVALLAYFRWFAPQVDDVALAAPAKSFGGLRPGGESNSGAEKGQVGAGGVGPERDAEGAGSTASTAPLASKGALAPPPTRPGTGPGLPGEEVQELLAVHVAGAVAAPGVYRLPTGARVVDAISAAGGALPEADANAVNLARFLRDGERVVVPRPGETVVEPAAGGVAGAGLGGNETGGAVGGGVGSGGGGGVTGGALVNINLASASQLEQLPGIGPSLAARIVTHREQNGPFQSVQGLLDVPGIGPAKFEALRGLVEVN